MLKAVASWNWIHDFFRDHRANGVGIGGSKMSKLLLSLTIVREKTSGIVHASFGNYTFAALGMRLEELKLDDRTYFRFTAANARVEFLYVLDPKNWEAIPYTATRLQFHGIAMRQCAPAMPLMRYSLGQKQHGLSEDDILNCVKQCEIELTSPHDQISDMFSALAKHFCGDAVDVAQADARL